MYLFVYWSSLLDFLWLLLHEQLALRVRLLAVVRPQMRQPRKLRIK
jgi:hypothetical protein